MIAAPADSGQLDVVLCDDVPELRELTRYGLEQDPRFRVAGEAASAEECLEVVAECRPEALLLDLSLPGMDGLEAIPRLREIEPGLAIVVFSGFAADRMESVALEQGADSYVEKGTALPALRDALIEAAAKRGVVVMASPASRPGDGDGGAPPLEKDGADAGSDLVSRRYETLSEHAPVGIFEADGAGALTRVNRRWSEITGAPADAALGDGWLETVDPEDRGRVEASWREMLDGGDGFAVEFRLAGELAAGRAVRAEAAAIGGPHGRDGFVGTLVSSGSVQADVERRRAVERELAHHAAELERSNQDLEQFAYVASHDLSQPINIIAGYVELLESRYAGALDEDGRRYIRSALDAIAKMRALIDDLLSYSRVGSQELVISEIDTAALVAEVVELLEPMRAEIGATVEVGALPVVRAEASMLARVFQNLISNAFKFGGEGVTVRVSSERTERGWELSVADDGPGVDPARAGRIFEMFQRAHGEEVEGTGIGLAICKRIVERHKGEIGYRPAPGGGSVFTFSLPPNA